MRKPTINQMKWQAILNQTQKALAEITKRTGQIFDEAALRPERPQRITQKKLTHLKQTQLDFIHKQVEDVIKNMRTHEAEELVHKVRTKEEYIRHPRISKGKKKYEAHPLTAAERSERARKAWKTRVERMTPEEREQYGKDFAERMRKAKQAKTDPFDELLKNKKVKKVTPEEIEKKLEQVPKIDDPFVELLQDEDTIILTPEEMEEELKKAPKLTDIIDYSVENALMAMLDDPDVIPERIPELVNTLNGFKSELGYAKYYHILNQNANDILEYSNFWLTYRHEGRARSIGLNKLIAILHEGALDLSEALKNSMQYDTELDDIE